MIAEKYEPAVISGNHQQRQEENPEILAISGSVFHGLKRVCLLVEKTAVGIIIG